MISEIRSFGNGVETVGVACMWLAVTLRAPIAVRSSEQRPLWLAVLGASAAVTLHLPWVNDLIYQVTGPTHLTALVRNLFGVLTSAAVLDFVFLAARGRHTFPLYGLAGLVMTALTWLDVHAEPHLTHTIPPVGDPVPSMTYWGVLIIVNLSTNVVCAIACWWYSRASQVLALRFGLRLFGLGAVFAGSYWLLSATYIGVRCPWILSILPLLLGCYAFARASAICVPLATAAAVVLRRMRILWQLRPLWRDLVDAVPNVRLAQSRQRDLSLLPRAALDFRLYRTVIEIRDATLALRAYIPQAVLDNVRAHLELENSSPAEVGPRVTACWLRIARHAKAGGAPPLPGDLAVPVLGGADLPSEIEFLRQAAIADTSPQIRELAARLGRPVAAH
ncbi:MAB_1171c family putative transporter [Streptomyces sp. 8N706]|uniref:MAB_1171c family putative transporter n=1 Tax=Streptomyces sp. 8N706 TaxID=3457416 RepID=UPI003FD4335F